MSIKKILVSQPRPTSEKSPYFDLEKKYGVEIVFRPFIKVEGLTSKEFRQSKINIPDYSAIILTARTAIDHFFRLCKELRYNVPDTLKYFCVSETVAHYLQKYVIYRKRKIFYSETGLMEDLIPIIAKHHKETYLMPVSDVHNDKALVLDNNKVKYVKAIMYRTVSNNFTPDEKFDYDMSVFFTPAGIKSYTTNFPDYKDRNVVIAAMGQTTLEAAAAAGLNVDITITPETPSMASAIDADFARIQFTPDLLPADLIGTLIYSQKKEEFVVRRGPIFANFVLADEINRSPAKVQSALLEAMQEHQVTIGDETFKLPDPFLVMATQNPIEQEGTYPLPEAQVDRFMLKVVINYPKKEEEKLILRQQIASTGANINAVVKPEDIIRAREVCREIYLDEKIENYITDIVFASRYPSDYKLKKFANMISYGGSPRATINLALAAKAYAFIKHRGYVIPEDIRAVAPDVLRHRIGLTYEAEAENITTEEIINEILNTIEVP